MSEHPTNLRYGKPGVEDGNETNDEAAMFKGS